jgi:glycerol-3-phosphate acyltransferase PlsX
VVKSHGGTDAKGFANAVKVAADMARSDYAQEIARNMGRLSSALERPLESAAVS